MTRYRWWLVGVFLFLGMLVALLQRARLHREQSQDKVIRAAAQRYDLDPALVKAVMWRESRFNPRAQGTKGEVGLMQLRDEAAREWAQAEGLDGFDHRQMFHPRRNTMAGAWYLRKLLMRYARTDDPVPYALAAYNAGASNVARWRRGAAATNSAAFIADIGFPSTRQYVQSVMKRRRRYRLEGGWEGEIPPWRNPKSENHSPEPSTNRDISYPKHRVRGPGLSRRGFKRGGPRSRTRRRVGDSISG